MVPLPEELYLTVLALKCGYRPLSGIYRFEDGHPECGPS